MRWIDVNLTQGVWSKPTTKTGKPHAGIVLDQIHALDGAPPVLAVKIQEVFGLADTPAVNEGRTRVLLHLLSPAQRPVQVTRDLPGFWRGSYAAVRSDLRGRYPRHPWPEDPWAAKATHRTTPRR